MEGGTAKLETSKESTHRKKKKGFQAPVKKNGWSGDQFLLPFTIGTVPVMSDFPGHPKPSGRKAVIVLTLQDLKCMVDMHAGGEKLPTAKQLRKSGVATVCERMGQDFEVSVFQNGYVLYRERNHSTVFPLHFCRDYRYLSGENMIHLSEQFFDNREWYLRLVLEGEDRLNRNHEEKERSWNVSYSAVSEEWAEAGNLAESVMDHLVRQETVEELLQVLTEKQKCIVQKYYLREETQEQISRELGISQQAVSAMLVRAVKSIREKCPAFQAFFGHRSYCAQGEI